MLKTKTLFLLAFLCGCTWFCAKAPQFPVEPIIQIVTTNKDTIPQGTFGAPSDTLEVRFEFTDGDADLGFVQDTFDVFLTDSRSGFVNTFRLPVIPELGNGNGISGEVTLKIPNQPFNICCVYQTEACAANPAYPVDTFSFTVQFRDQAGNFSNKMQSEKIYILCN